ncbi:MAG TPA: DUF5320 domain-containing protein [Sedimentisphaerales bacterium]|nr:DUF5320 domain-containing protein [Sedimentisphaerales bacterium]
MPRGDRTGPAGSGPMTGRAAGFCAGYPVPGFMHPIGGRGYWGWGRGRGFWGGGGGRGWRHWYYATGMPGWARAGYGYPAAGWPGYPYGTYEAPGAPTPTAEQELAGLKQQGEYFESALDEIKERMKEMEQEEQK